MDLSVVNHEDYFAKIGDDHKFPINKFGELAKYLIDKKITELQDNSKDDKDKVLEEVMSYYSLKKLLSAKLNRVV